MINKVLCIDDDAVTLMLCKLVIKKTAFAKEVLTVQNGAEALGYYQQLIDSSKKTENIDYPRVVLLDLNMPIMGGWEFLLKFKKLFSTHFTETKVFILSSTIDPEDIEKAEEFSFITDFLPKPITTEMVEKIK